MEACNSHVTWCDSTGTFAVDLLRESCAGQFGCELKTPEVDKNRSREWSCSPQVGAIESMFAEERTPKVPAPHFCVKHCKLLASTYRCVLYVCNYIILRTVVVASLTLSLSLATVSQLSRDRYLLPNTRNWTWPPKLAHDIPRPSPK